MQNMELLPTLDLWKTAVHRDPFIIGLTLDDRYQNLRNWLKKYRDNKVYYISQQMLWPEHGKSLALERICYIENINNHQ